MEKRWAKQNSTVNSFCEYYVLCYVLGICICIWA